MLIGMTVLASCASMFICVLFLLLAGKQYANNKNAAVVSRVDNDMP